MLTEQQIEQRINYLGGNDAAAVLGISRYRTVLQIWALKTGQILPEDIATKMPVRLGNMLEEAVCKLFEEETGKTLLPAPETLFHPQYKFIGGNLDRFVKDERAFFEAKTTNSYKQSEWEEGDEIPVEYQIQCHHYLAVTGLDRAYIGCLIGNRKFVWRIIERDEKLLDDLIQKEVAFWNNFVVLKIMPMTITAEDSDILYRLYLQASPESVIELGDDVSMLCESLNNMQAECKELEGEIEKQKNEIRARMKTYETALTAKYKITWRNQRTKKIDLNKLKTEEPAIYKRFLKDTLLRVLRIAPKK